MHFLLEIWLQKIFLTSPCPACLYHSVEVYTTYICMVILHQAKKRKIWTFFHDFRQCDIFVNLAQKNLKIIFEIGTTLTDSKIEFWRENPNTSI